MPKGRRRTSEQAAASGFPLKLRDWIAYNLREYEAGRGIHGPRNKRQVAKAISAQGVKTGATAVGSWAKAQSLPSADAIAALEVVMGATWAYLHSRKLEWITDRDERARVSLIATFAPDERAGVLRALSAALASSRQRGPRG